MLRKALLATASSPRMRGWLLNHPAGRAVIARFVAGRDVPAVLATAEALIAQGLQVTIDHLGEYTTDFAQAEAVRDEYLRLLALVASAGIAGTDVSVKLSALGQTLPGGEAQALRHASAICEAATRAGTTVTLDMEDHTTTDSTLGVLAELRRHHAFVGVALQAALHRTEADVARLAAEGCRIRLCKGAYAEPASAANQRRADVEKSFRACVDLLMAQPGCYPMIATHHPGLIAYAQASAARHARTRADHEYQMLYGVRPQEQRRLAGGGCRTRIYLPYGTDSIAYFLRRLAERPANVAFFLRALTDAR